MNFSAWAIRNPVAPLLAFFLLLVLGIKSFYELPITRFPNIDMPLVLVSVAQSGATPAELETQVTREVEDAVAGITGVKSVSSTVRDGASSTIIEFRMEIPTEEAVQDVKDAVDAIRGDLPADVEEPIVRKINVESQAILSFGVSAPNMTMEELSWFVDNTIIRELQGKAGVGQVDRFGGADREIRVELDPVRLGSYGITAAQVSAQLRITNINIGAGRAEFGDGEQAIRTLGDARTVAQLSETMIALPNGRYVRLHDLGKILDTYQELRSFVRFNGEAVVAFSVFRAKGASEVSVAETVHKTLDEIRAAHPDVAISLIDDAVYYTYGNYEAALNTLIEGSLLAVLVVFLFLRNFRATFISAIALPLSAIPTFWVMSMLGFSLNLVSFLALTLATGILVDDAIVEIENIARHIRMGKSPYRAAIEAADEIGLAVIATTFTIIAVFVPVSFMPGIPGQYFSQFGLTVAISVAFSLLVARLITPMMAAYLMRSKDAAGHGEQGDGRMMRAYMQVVKHSTTGGVPFFLPNFMLPARYITLALAFVVLMISVYFMGRIPGSFMPPEDVSRFVISVELPPGSKLSETDRRTSEILARIKDVEGVENVFVLGGANPFGALDLRRASVTVLLEKLDHSLLYRVAKIADDVPLLSWLVPDMAPKGRVRPQYEIEDEVFTLLKTVPDIRALKLNDRGEQDVSFSILSDNEQDLNNSIARLQAAMVGNPNFVNVGVGGALPRPELQVIPKLDEAARLGVTTGSIAQTLRVATIGDFDGALAKLSIDNRLIPMRVRLNNEMREDLARLSVLRVVTASGAAVPLSSVADIRITKGTSLIERRDFKRRATIGANLPPGVALDTATAEFTRIMNEVKLPPSVVVAEAGDAEVQQEVMQGFMDAMILGLLLVLTVLILLFRSVIQPFTILFSLPLAIGGVAAALLITNSAVSMPVLIGILMLMGIVTKNAILLVDFAIEMRARGMDRFTAVMEAGHKRAQPIVMTSIAMSAGMLPSALGVGEGGAFRSPMAIAVIGGIIASTILSLVVVPAFFLIMDDLSKLCAYLFRGMVGRKADETPPLSPGEIEENLNDLERRLRILEGGLLPPDSKPKLAVAE